MGLPKHTGGMSLCNQHLESGPNSGPRNAESKEEDKAREDKISNYTSSL